MPKFALVVRIVLLLVSCQSMGACGLDGLRHDLCTEDSDCDPGHVCVEGACRSPLADAGRGDEGSDARDAADGYDASDARDPDDASGDVRDPCMLTEDDGPHIKVSELPGALLGVWRTCDPTPSPEVSWLLGPNGTIQIDATTWQRPEVFGPGPGLYFLILEGTRGLVHFIDPDPVGSAGTDFSASIWTDSRVLELSPCDGPETCSGHVSRFVPADPALPGG